MILKVRESVSYFPLYPISHPTPVHKILQSPDLNKLHYKVMHQESQENVLKQSTLIQILSESYTQVSITYSHRQVEITKKPDHPELQILS